IWALLPRRHAIKKYQKGENLLATATGLMISKYFVVSQKIPPHVQNVIKLIVPLEVLKEHDAFIDKIATLKKHNLAKVSVWGKIGQASYEEVGRIFLPYLKKISEHAPKCIFVPSGEPHTKIRYNVNKPFSNLNFLLNALLPAPIEKIVDYFFNSQKREIVIALKNENIPLFMWKDYVNVKLASKLTKVIYTIKNVDTGVQITVDPLNIALKLNQNLPIDSIENYTEDLTNNQTLQDTFNKEFNKGRKLLF
ncbi:MAG: hypothetical protein NZ850_07795, partial [Caldimicrobium sp.]|nr:hypothetical protein [Caldimicrobium sp.]